MSDTAVLQVQETNGIPGLIARRLRPKRDQPSYILKERVEGIINRVRNHGDKALIEFSRWFDKVDLCPAELVIPREAVTKAYEEVTENQVAALEEVAARLRTVSEQTLSRMSFSMDIEGTTITSTYRPLSEVGCYVPGGIAAYPSSLLMCAIPARVAGVDRIVVCTPPKPEGISPLTLVAADMCGIEEIYQVGGAQAVAALALGTQTIRPVQKIVGPGNAYVAIAKSEVSRYTQIDMPAGPSELLVIGDDSASPNLIALDLISQAEHSTDAISILISSSEKLCNAVAIELDRLLLDTPRSEIVLESLRQNGGIYRCNNLEECIKYTKEYGAEHVQIMTEDAAEIAEQVTSAGLILLGDYTPVASSDYGLGVNHILPTSGYASTYSGLSVLDFVRLVQIAESTEASLRRIASTISTLAEAEGLPNHARAIQGRFEG
ncbi:MAG: histidinol dehydrogenase [Candidatus Thorarchaeota archaeon]